MAFGFPPRYSEELPLNNLTEEQFLAIAIAAAKTLEWNVGETNGKGFTAFTGFSMTSWSEKIEVSIGSGTPKITSQCAGSQILDYGKNEHNVKKLIETVHELLNSFTTKELDDKYAEIKANPVQSSLKRPKLTNPLSIFVPTEGYFITPILIDLNIAIYLLMVISGVNFFLPTTESLITWGANFRPMTLEGQWWRLLTNCFLHIGIIHLLMNMYALLYIGMMLEPHLGRLRFLSAYLLTGITASMASVSFHELIVSAGASGAIFGMYGVFLAMLTTNLIDKAERNTMLRSILVFVVYNLAYGMKAGIDNAAHIGGLFGGLIIGYAFVPGLKMPENLNLRNATIAVLAVIIIAGCYIEGQRVSNDVGKYYSEMERFGPMEAKAVGAIRSAQSAPKADALALIKDKGIYEWDAIRTMITNLDTLKLPESLHDKNRLLIQYCDLRIKAYEFTYRDINEETSAYRDSIVSYNQQITDLYSSLKEEKSK